MTKIKIEDFRLRFKDYGELECKTPCSLYSVLYEKGLIDDPFFGDNWRYLASLSDGECSFSADFEVPVGLLASKNVLLRLTGIDTVAMVELNGMPLVRTDNMSRSYLVDVKPRLHAGKNTITLYFDSPIKEMEHRRSMARPGTEEDGAPREAYLRKAELTTDGRFCPSLSDMGILGEVELVAFNHKIIDGVRVSEVFLEDGVRLDLELETLGYDEGVRALATLVSPGGSVFYCGFVNGKGSITVKEPNLWWPMGLGVQNIYKLCVSLYCDGTVEDTKEYSVGIRNLTIDQNGRGLLVGGQKIFAMGTEMLPCDSLLSRISKEKERALVRAAVTAGINLVKLKGVYPSDNLLDLFDKSGIMLMLDITPPAPELLMVAVTRESLKQELIHNFGRMSTHPCLALVTSEDAPMRCGEEYSEFSELLTKVAEATLTGARLYLAEGKDGEELSFPKIKDPFVSLPGIKQLSEFSLREDMNLFSASMEAHAEGVDGNVKLIDELYSSYPYPSGLSEIIYTTQLAAAESARAEVEKLRIDRNNGIGAIYSRLNDCWPAISPAGLDYRLQPKALHYKAARFFAPTTVIAQKNGTRVNFYLSNERRISFEGTLSYSLMDQSFKTVKSGGATVSQEPLSASLALSVDFDELVRGREGELVLVYEIAEGAVAISKGTLLFTNPKRFKFEKPKVDWHIAGSGKDFSITLSSTSLCLGVELGFTDIDVRFEDNFFDITSVAPVKIAFHTEEGTAPEILRKQFYIRTLNEIGKSF